MTKANCGVCGKALAKGADNNRCRLCSIGLTPAAHDQGTGIFNENASSASGRVLSGSHCPDCRAELSLADLSLKRCGICNETLNLEALNQDIQIRQTRVPTFQPQEQLNQS